MDEAYRILFIVILFCLGVGILFALIRAIRGPRTADRIMGVNMIGTMSLLAIAVIALLCSESWLLDVSLIYGMISFLAVLALVKTHIAGHKKEKEENEDG